MINVILLALALAGPPDLAYIIAGEVPTCPIDAKIAVAQVHANRTAANIKGGWFGWRAPSPVDILAAQTWQHWPDLTDGAIYAISTADRPKLPWLTRMVKRWDCPNGFTLELWHDARSDAKPRNPPQPTPPPEPQLDNSKL